MSKYYLCYSILKKSACLLTASMGHAISISGVDISTRSSRKDIGDAGLGRNNVIAFEKDIVPSVDIFTPKI